MRKNSDINPGREPHKPYDPRVSADRRANWERELNTGRQHQEPSRWNGVDRP